MRRKSTREIWWPNVVYGVECMRYHGNRREELLRHVEERGPAVNAILARPSMHRDFDASENTSCMLTDAHDPSFSSDFSVVVGVALESAGETDVEGGEAGFSGSPDPNPARRLNAFAEVASFSFC